MQDTNNYYRFGGLLIQSYLPLLAYPAAAGAADVVIRRGETPQTLDDASVSGTRWQASPERFLFRKENAASYLVLEGREIIVQPCPGASERAIRNYLMSAAMGAVFHQRGLLPLHASAVQVGEGCVAFAGASGAGKSTLAAWLVRQRGYALLAEDICVVDCADSEIRVHPGVPYLRLWQDALHSLGVSADECTPSIVTNKYHLPGNDSYCARSLPLRGVYLLDKFPATQGFQALEDGRGTRGLMANTFRSRFLSGAMQLHEHFRCCSAVADNVPVYTLGLDRQFKTLGSSLSKLENHWCDKGWLGTPTRPT